MRGKDINLALFSCFHTTPYYATTTLPLPYYPFLAVHLAPVSVLGAAQLRGILAFQAGGRASWVERDTFGERNDTELARERNETEIFSEKDETKSYATESARGTAETGLFSKDDDDAESVRESVQSDDTETIIENKMASDAGSFNASPRPPARKRYTSVVYTTGHITFVYPFFSNLCYKISGDFGLFFNHLLFAS